MSRPLTSLEKKILDESAANWFKNPAGISGLDLAEQLGTAHNVILKTLEDLCVRGFGSINRDVQLTQVTLDTENLSNPMTYAVVVTHIFFPSKNILSDMFYGTDLPRQGLPEYKVRLMLGAHQLGLVFFDEAVLSRYMHHPESYSIHDTLAGGEITSLGGIEPEKYLYVRYGKCRMENQSVAVTAIYKDLADMGKSEQRFWHAHELEAPTLNARDEHFQAFISRSYEGSWVDFSDPIGDVWGEIRAMNDVVSPKLFFTRSENVHLRMPVEQTYKSYCDCASELYKVVGPDGMAQGTMKEILKSFLAVTDEDLRHKNSGRPLSTLQLLILLETRLGVLGVISQPLDKVQKLRIDADHRVLEADMASGNYSQLFSSLCQEVVLGMRHFRDALRKLS